MSTATITKSQDEFNQEVKKFLVELKKLTHSEREAFIALSDQAENLKQEILVRTCPEWCDKAMHFFDSDIVEWWHETMDGAGLMHTRNFGGSVDMGNQDGEPGVSFYVSIDVFGGVIKKRLDMPKVLVDRHEQESVAQARVLGDAILEAADFWEKWQERASA
jgi:hypothetical protein